MVWRGVFLNNNIQQITWPDIRDLITCPPDSIMVKVLKPMRENDIGIRHSECKHPEDDGAYNGADNRDDKVIYNNIIQIFTAYH